MSDGNLFRRALQRRVTQSEPESRPPSPILRDPTKRQDAPAPTLELPRHAWNGQTDYRLVRPDVPPEVIPQRRHALVVEDDAVLREGAAAVLADEGWAVVEAGTLEDARSILDFMRPDVMILDFNLQGEYASVFLDEIVHRGRGVPTVLASASPLAIDAARAYGLELLMKPFEIEKLIATVNRITRERTSAPIRRAG